MINLLKSLGIAFAALLCVATNASAQSGFPVIDRAKLRITLVRSACFGACPDYKVTIDGDGNVMFASRGGDLKGAAMVHRAFSDRDGILVSGRFIDKIEPGRVDALIAKFREANFFALNDSYQAMVTDNPTYIVTIETGNGTKQVTDYVGKEVGMPEAVTALEKAIDEAAGTGRWVNGDAGLVEWLSARHFDFKSDRAVAIAMEGASNQAADETIVGFIDRGLPLDKFVSDTANERSRLGKVLTRESVRTGRPSLLSKLAGLGWLRSVPAKQLGIDFAEGAAACSPELVDFFAANHLPIDIAPARGKTALGQLATSYNCSDENRRVQTARRLIAAGALVNRADSGGETAFFGVENTDLLALLYANGANATALDRKGCSAAFSSWTDAIVLMHLQHGASTAGKCYDGKTMRQLMKERPMPMVDAWLKQHGS